MTTLQRPGPSAPADGPRGVDLLSRPALNMGTAFADDERSWLGLHGLARQRAVAPNFVWPPDIAERVVTALAHLTGTQA